MRGVRVVLCAVGVGVCVCVCACVRGGVRGEYPADARGYTNESVQ